MGLSLRPGALVAVVRACPVRAAGRPLLRVRAGAARPTAQRWSGKNLAGFSKILLKNVIFDGIN